MATHRVSPGHLSTCKRVNDSVWYNTRHSTCYCSIHAKQLFEYSSCDSASRCPSCTMECMGGQSALVRYASVSAPADGGHYGIAPVDQGHFVSLLQLLSVLSLHEDVRTVEYFFCAHRRVLWVLLCSATALLYPGEVEGDSAVTGEGNVAWSHRVDHLRAAKEERRRGHFESMCTSRGYSSHST